MEYSPERKLRSSGSLGAFDEVLAEIGDPGDATRLSTHLVIGDDSELEEINIIAWERTNYLSLLSWKIPGAKCYRRKAITTLGFNISWSPPPLRGFKVLPEQIYGPIEE